MSDTRPRCHLKLLATGGTIEKTYDAHEGRLTLDNPVIEDILAGLDHPDIVIEVVRVMAMDSLEMKAPERAAVCRAADEALSGAAVDGLIVIHGTDTLAATAKDLQAHLSDLAVPVVLTGAMRPYRVAASDAAQNVAQAIMAARLLAPGVYSVMHGRALAADEIVKDYDRLTFVSARD